MIKLNQLDPNLVDTSAIGKRITDLLSSTGNSVIGGVFCDVNREAEHLLEKYTGSKNVLTSSGTAALLISVEYALQLTKTKIRIYISEFIYFSLLSAIESLGYSPVVLKASVDETTLEIPDQENDFYNIFILTSHNNIDVNIKDIEKKFKKEDRFIIEDRCLMMGNLSKNSPDVACYSFSNNKMIIAGEGGCVSSHDEEFISWARWRTFSNIKPTSKNSWFMYTGDYNYSKSLFPVKCSATGLIGIAVASQCNVLEKIIEKRRLNFSLLMEELHNSDLFFPLPTAPLFYPLVLPSKFCTDNDVKKFQIRCLKLGLQTHLGILPYSFYKTGQHNKRIVNIPVHSALSDNDLDAIISIVKGLL